MNFEKLYSIRLVQWMMINLILIECCLLSLISSNSNYNSGNLSPVILIPGLSGNQLDANIKTSTIGFSRIWLNSLLMIPTVVDDWAKKMKLVYNKQSRKTENSPGIEIRTPEWGQTERIEWLDETPIIKEMTAYFHSIVKALVERGYARGKTVLGAPYDFRKAPNENKDWFKKLKQLTENAFKTNNKNKVTYIVHSMGGKMILHFLQQMPQNWKDQYVNKVIALAVPWGGSVDSIHGMSVGINFAGLLPKEKIKPVLETFSSLVWLMPSGDLWEDGEVLVQLANTNYTIANIDEYFKKINIPNVVEMRKDLSNYHDFTAPGVEMHCLFGNKLETTKGLDFKDSFHYHPKLSFEHGDGTVNERSLLRFRKWKTESSQGKHKIHEQEFRGVTHIKLLKESKCINYILRQLNLVDDYSEPFDPFYQESETMKFLLF